VGQSTRPRRRTSRARCRGCSRSWFRWLLAELALKIAEELRHPAYDCFYLALAKETNARLVTADRLAKRVNGTRWGALATTLWS
jgi:predicted nucleic acid-binding protein